MEPIIAIGFIMGCLIAYFLPSLVASRRKHSNLGAIQALNIFLGWTFIGWVIALIWSLTDNVKTKA